MTIEIANRLQEYRKKNGLSQEQLAEKLGISRQAVSKWERAESSPDTDNLIALANLYGVSLDELLGHCPTQSAKPPKDHISFANGIHVHSKNGDKVDIDFSGIHVDSPKDNAHVHIDSNGVFVNDDGQGIQREKPQAQKVWEHFPYPLIAIVAYLLFGILDICGGWAFGWMVLLTIPLYYSLISAIFSKNPEHFAYPVLVVLVYLYLGFDFNLWHPMWILFLTIPIYYCLTDCIRKMQK